MVTRELTLSVRSNCSQMFFKIGVLKNFAIFTGKHLVCMDQLKFYNFLHVGELKKVQYNFKIFQHFSQYVICKLSGAYNKEFCYILFLFVLQFHVTRQLTDGGVNSLIYIKAKKYQSFHTLSKKRELKANHQYVERKIADNFC